MNQLVARDAEVRLLTDFALTPEGGSDLLVLAGPHGVGKTAILSTVLGAAEDVRKLRARGVPWEAEIPYGVLQQLTGSLDVGDWDSAAHELRRAVGSANFTLVVVEDAQWADADSLQLLSSLVRLEPALGLRVVVVRATDATDVRSRVDSFFETTADSTVVVAPLDAAGVGQLASSLGLDLSAVVTERLVSHTAGLPRHVVDLAGEAPPGTWGSTGDHLPVPKAVARQIGRRLDALSPEARRFVETIAVLEPQALMGDVAVMSEVPEPLSAFEESERAGFIRSVDVRGSWSLAATDPMVRQAVLNEMGAVARAGAHERAAELLTDPVGRLRHRVAASSLPDAQLANELDLVAGDRANDGGWAEAAELLTLASRLTADSSGREDRLLRAVDALIGAGDTLAATALVPEVESFRETPLRNAVLGYLAIVRGRFAEADVRLRRAWDLVSVEREPDIAALICQRHVLHELARCEPAELVVWADRAIGLVPAGAPAAVESQAIRGLGVGGGGDPEAGMADYDRLTAEAQAGAQAQRIAMGRGWLSLAVDEVDEARSALQSALPTSFFGGSTRISLWAHGWLARAHFVSGDWDDAMRVAQRGVGLATRSGMGLMEPLLRWTVVQIHALRGNWELAETSMRTGAVGDLDYCIMRVPTALARAHRAEAEADYQGVMRALSPLTRPGIGEGVNEPGFWPWVDIYANALVVEGQLEEAESLLGPHENLARARGHRSTMARLGYARGRLHGAHGDLEAARTSFEESLMLLDELPLPYDRARVNFAYGQTLRRAGKRRDADVVMTRARDLFLAVGASTYVERCDRELKAGGVRAKQGRASSELTPQETLVADLVARGRSNREVATELFISTKTVQYHLTRTYAKLGIRSRSELAATWAQETELDG